MEKIQFTNNNITFDMPSALEASGTYDDCSNYEASSIFLNSSENSFNSKSENLEILEEEFKQVQDKQGFIGKAWNGIKNLLGVGVSSNKVENKIEQYKNGEISYEEALATIQKYETKQENTVNLISNVATGLATAGVAASAFATGGLSLGVVAAGAGIGGATKAGLKTLDRATNGIEGDALDGKQILKDSLTGAIDGAVSTATAGMVKTPAVGTSIKTAIKNGTIQGAKAGAISGAATGAGDYAVEAAFEDDVDFTVSGFLKSTATTAAAGGIFGGLMGGVSSGISQARLNAKAEKINAGEAAVKEVKQMTPAEKEAYEKAMGELNKSGDELADVYKKNIDTVKSQYKWAEDLDSVEVFSARAKGNKNGSIFSKLKKKFESGKLTSTDVDSCASVMGDGYGVRIQLKQVSNEEAKEIVESTLGAGTYDDFINALNDSIQAGKTLPAEYSEVFDILKEKQTGEFFSTFVEKVRKGEISLADDEFNNYGSEITSYFTDNQLAELASAYNEATGKKLPIVTKSDINASITKEVDGAIQKIEISETTAEQAKKAVKESGYTTAQGNVKSNVTNGTTLADTELQIRGTKTNTFGDVEHIPYDIRQGKASFADHPEVYTILKGMSEDSYKSYNRYLTDTYTALRFEELGLPVELPSITSSKYGGVFTYGTADELKKTGLDCVLTAGKKISSKDLQKITMEGLSNLK